MHGWLLRRQGCLTAWLSTLLLLSAFGFQHAARVGETDTLLSLFCLLAVLGLAELLLDNPKGWLLFFTGFALALMTKGAASFTLPLTALALTVLHPRRIFRYPQTFTAGVALFLAVTLPWHIYVYLHFGQPFFHDYVGFHTLTRATHAIEDHQTRPWFYLWVLLLSAPPFALLYPLALAAPFRSQAVNAPQTPSTATRQNVQHRSRRPSNPLQALATFFLILLILFTAASTRLPHYIAPAYPVLSALTAALITRWLQASLPLTRALAFQLASAALILYAASAILTAKARKTLHNPELRTGYYTPDNRESVALLQQLRHSHTSLPPGPLLVWRQTPSSPSPPTPSTPNVSPSKSASPHPPPTFPRSLFQRARTPHTISKLPPPRPPRPLPPRPTPRGDESNPPDNWRYGRTHSPLTLIDRFPALTPNAVSSKLM